MATQPIFTHSLFQAGSQVANTTARFALVAQGPALPPEEVEVAHKIALEVVVAWGDNILHVAHLDPPRSFTLGEGGDYLVPEQMLGTTSVPLIHVHNASSSVTVPLSAAAAIETKGDVVHLEANGAGTREVNLDAGTRVRVSMPGGQLSITVSAVAAGRKVERGLMNGVAAGALKHVGVSFLLHAALVGSMAFFMPSMNSEDSEETNRDQIVMMQKYLNAAADKEAEKIEEQNTSDSAGAKGGEGKRAQGEEGKAGSSTSTASNKRWAKQGPADNANPELSRAAQLKEASTQGLIGVLNSMDFGDPNAPSAPWAKDVAQGKDAQSFMGNMWGAEAGESFGLNGLGLSGTGESGGGIVPGNMGLGNVGTMGHGTGCTSGNCADGIGGNHGRPNGPGYKPKSLTMREPGTVVNGQLPAEVIQRIVRQNFGRMRMCYENGLRTNPTLTGRVATRFIIGRDGAVASAQDGGSDLPDQGVVSCVVRSFQGLSFPQPQGGLVTVTYPIQFAPGGE